MWNQSRSSCFFYPYCTQHPVIINNQNWNKRSDSTQTVTEYKWLARSCRNYGVTAEEGVSFCLQRKHSACQDSPRTVLCVCSDRTEQIRQLCANSINPITKWIQRSLNRCIDVEKKTNKKLHSLSPDQNSLCSQEQSFISFRKVTLVHHLLPPFEVFMLCLDTASEVRKKKKHFTWFLLLFL